MKSLLASDTEFKCHQCGRISPKIDSFFLDSLSVINVKMKCKCQNTQMTLPLSSFLSKLESLPNTETNCFYHPSSPSISNCSTCAQSLCLNCFKEHQMLMEGHCTSKRLSQAPVRCFPHSSDILYHCFDCAAGCCLQCKSEQHKGHSMIDLKDNWARINSKTQFDINKEADALLKQKDSLDRHKESINCLITQLEQTKAFIEMQNHIISQNELILRFVHLVQQQFLNSKSSNDFLSMLNYEHLSLSPLAEMFKETVIANSLQTIRAQTEVIQKELTSLSQKHNYYVQVYSTSLQSNLVSKKPYQRVICINKKHISKCERVINARNPIFGLVELNNGKVASYSNQDFISVWNVLTGMVVNTLRGHDSSILAVNLLRDGRLISGDSNDHIIIWSSENDSISHQITGNATSFTQLNNDCVLTTTKSGYIEYYHINENRKIFSISGHEMTINCSIPLSSELYATGSNDKTIKVWNLLKNQLLKALHGHQEGVNCLLKLDAQRIASGSSDKTICIWDFTNFSCVRSFRAHNEAVRQLCLLSNEQFVSCSFEPLIKLWDKATYQLNCEMKNSFFNTRGIVYTRQGELVVAASEKTIQIWR